MTLIFLAPRMLNEDYMYCITFVNSIICAQSESENRKPCASMKDFNTLLAYTKEIKKKKQYPLDRYLRIF